MAEIAPATALEQVLAVLREAYEGPAHDWSYFTDTKPNAGIFGTLSPVSAVTTSTAVAETSVAAHVFHVNFAMEAATAWIRRRYDALIGAVSTHALQTEEGIGGAVAAVAHAAYHLGAIRQKLAVLRTT